MSSIEIDKLSLVDVTKMDNISLKEDSELDFTRPWKFCDVVFIVENKRVYASKMCLHLWSSYFDTLISEAVEKDDYHTVVIDGTSFRDMIELMRVIHPPGQPIGEDNVEALLSLGNTFSISKLMLNCEDVLLNQEMSLHLYELSLKFHLKRLEEKFIEHIWKVPISNLLIQSEIESLAKSDSLVFNLLKRCDLAEKRVTSLGEQLNVQLKDNEDVTKRLKKIKVEFSRYDAKKTCVVYEGQEGFKMYARFYLSEIVLEEEVKTEYVVSNDCIWWITIKSLYSEKTKDKMLSLFLYCKPHFKFTSSWSCKSMINFILENKNSSQNLRSQFTHSFSDKEPNRGFSDFISIKNLVAADSGYYENNTLAFEFNVKNEKPVVN